MKTQFASKKHFNNLPYIEIDSVDCSTENNKPRHTKAKLSETYVYYYPRDYKK